MTENFEQMNDFELWNKYMELTKLYWGAKAEIDRRELLAIPIGEWSMKSPKKDLTSKDF